jgi:hypothetical protein
MDLSLRNYIKTNALMGADIKLGENLPIIKMPSIKDIGDIYPYLYLFTKYIGLYDDKKDEMFFDLHMDEKSMLDFALFLKYFTNIDNLAFGKSCFIFDENTNINIENIGLFMKAIRILHHTDKESDYYTYTNSLVDKMLKRAKEAKKRIEEEKAKIREKSNKTNEESGFAEILSTVSARHPSINLLNINKLNYYQIIEQYKRLIEIDKYQPVLNGNATEEYLKELKHYSSKLINKD